MSYIETIVSSFLHYLTLACCFSLLLVYLGKVCWFYCPRARYSLLFSAGQVDIYTHFLSVPCGVSADFGRGFSLLLMGGVHSFDLFQKWARTVVLFRYHLLCNILLCLNLLGVLHVEIGMLWVFAFAAVSVFHGELVWGETSQAEKAGGLLLLVIDTATRSNDDEIGSGPLARRVLFV